MRVSITELHVYPVKSTRGAARARVLLTPFGFEWDRKWMIVDEKGTFISQRSHPQMARIVPEVTPEDLLLKAPGLPTLTVPLALTGPPVPVRIWKDSCVGVDQGRDAHEWVSRAVGQPLRLIRVAPDMGRHANPEYAGTTPAPIGFPDGYPILICNEASLEDLNTRLPEPIPMERFRPNIVVKGMPAWAEDHIDTLTIGDVKLRLVKPCTRCTIPSIDQRTGERSTDPGPALKAFRFSKALLGVMFGENAVIAAGVGTVVQRGDEGHVTFEPSVVTPQ
jgi:uncharacterized protein YcbX